MIKKSTNFLYATTIDAMKTKSEVEMILVRVGAEEVHFSYDPADRKPISVSFQVMIEGLPYVFKIDTKHDVVYKRLRAFRKNKLSDEKLMKVDRERSFDIAWRLILTKIKVLLEDVSEFDSYDIRQVLMGYWLVQGDATLFDVIRDKGLLDQSKIGRLLPAPANTGVIDNG